MTDCIHLKLNKLADTTWEGFASFKDGWRFYRCENCGRIFKVRTAEAHPVNVNESAAQPLRQEWTLKSYTPKKAEAEKEE